MYRAKNPRLAFFTLGVLLTFFSVNPAAIAQTIPDIPGPADAGRINNRIESMPAPVPSTAAAESSQIPNQPPVNAPPGAEKIHLILNGLHIEGSTIYSQGQLSEFYKHYIGREIILSDVYRIAEEITKRYAQDGYVLSRAVVPPQQITKGHVTILVIEGSISEVHMQGAYKETALTRGVIAHIKSMHPLNANDFERDILLLNDLGGVVVRAIMEPISDKNPRAGMVAARLIFTEKPAAYSATIDNYGSRYLGPLEASVNTTQAGLINPYDQLSVSGIGSIPFSELRYMSAQYNLPLTSDGFYLTLAGGYGTAHPGYRLISYDIQNRSSSVSARLNWQIIRQRAENLTLSAGFSAKDIASDILGSVLYNDRLRELHATANYSFYDDYQGANNMAAEITHGLSLFGASDTGSLDLSRAAGHSDFTKLNLTATRLQEVANHLQLYVAAAGQITNHALLTSEEFGYGGQLFGRGYDASEILGDQGVAAALELRYNGLPTFDVITSQPFVFYDVGKVWSLDNITPPQSGASAGFGVRFTTDYHISGTFTLAKPLTRDVAAKSSQNARDTRGFFSLSSQF